MDFRHRSILIRKFLHLGLLIPLGVYWWVATIYSFQVGIYTLLGFLIFGLFYETLRLEFKMPVPLVHYIKRNERDAQVAGINLLLAIIVLHAVFPPGIALSVSLVAIIGDVVSGLGRLYGRIRLRSDSLQSGEGLLIAFLVDALIFIAVLGPGWYVGILAAVAVILENITSTVDDNLVVPFVVGILAHIILML